MTPLLTVESITKRFGDTPVVQDVSFTVHPGENLCAFGTQWLWKDNHLTHNSGI